MLECTTTAIRKSRKEYVCDLCYAKIAIGEEYVRYSGKYDGEFFDWKYHVECHKVIDAYLRETGECEYDGEAISEWLNEAVCCNLCDIETRDDCFRSAMRCEMVLKYLEKLEGNDENA